MDSIKMMGKVIIKQVVTDGYKEKAGAEFRSAVTKVDQELATFDKDMQKTLTELTLKGHPQIEQLRRQFNMEREKIAIYKEQLMAGVKEIIDLPEGSVIETGEGNFLHEIKVGDHFANNTVREIILKDDVVIEIK